MRSSCTTGGRAMGRQAGRQAGRGVAHMVVRQTRCGLGAAPGWACCSVAPGGGAQPPAWHARLAKRTPPTSFAPSTQVATPSPRATHPTLPPRQAAQPPSHLRRRELAALQAHGPQLPRNLPLLPPPPKLKHQGRQAVLAPVALLKLDSQEGGLRTRGGGGGAGERQA
jgi:hypothetical protein